VRHHDRQAGNGKLNGMESPPSVEAMADWCHAELVKSGIAAPCRVLAMSLGAMVTVAWAQRHPDDIAVHSEAGHDLPLDDGAWVVQRILEWSDAC
jgi:pimeloyl-ACP methyl ester carboxylesterase